MLVITDLLGRVILTYDEGTRDHFMQPVMLDQLSHGIYEVIMKSNDSFVYEKLVIER